MLRSFLAALAGYLLFLLSAVVLFRVAGVDPHEPPGTAFGVLSVCYGIGFAVLAGWLAARLSATPAHAPWWPVIAVAAVIALGAIGSLVVMLRQGGSVWSPVATLLLMAPAVLAGGALARRRRP